MVFATRGRGSRQCCRKGSLCIRVCRAGCLEPICPVLCRGRIYLVGPRVRHSLIQDVSGLCRKRRGVEEHTNCPNKDVKRTVLDVRSTTEVDELNIAISVKDYVFILDVTVYYQSSCV